MEIRPPPLVYLEGENRCLYHWSTGKTVGTFLALLRDHRKIVGAVCGGCGIVIVPPTSYCEICSSEVKELREVGPAGVVMSWSRVPEMFENAPLEAPFRYVLVRLAGADTSLIHLAPDDERIRIGARVKPEFRDKRKGDITDIKWFVLDEEEGRE